MDAKKYEITGWRYVDDTTESAPFVGKMLENSHVWIGDEPTDDELNGTCAWETKEACENYAQYSKGYGWIVCIGGDNCGTAGELEGEILIGNAIILNVEKY